MPQVALFAGANCGLGYEHQGSSATVKLNRLESDKWQVTGDKMENGGSLTLRGQFAFGVRSGDGTTGLRDDGPPDADC